MELSEALDDWPSPNQPGGGGGGAWPGGQKQPSGPGQWPNAPQSSGGGQWPSAPQPSGGGQWPGPQASGGGQWPGGPQASGGGQWPAPSAPNQPSGPAGTWPSPQPSGPGGWSSPAQPSPSQPSGPGGWSSPAQPSPSQPSGPGGWSSPAQPSPSQPSGPGQWPGPAQPSAPSQPSPGRGIVPPQPNHAGSYKLDFPRGLHNNNVITIAGTVKHRANKFALDFHTTQDLVFHFNPRFNEGGRQVIVRNSEIGKKWGREERDLHRPFPFVAGQNFEMRITVTHGEFRVEVNGSPLLNFKHRASNLGSVSHLSVHYDVTLSKLSLD